MDVDVRQQIRSSFIPLHSKTFTPFPVHWNHRRVYGSWKKRARSFLDSAHGDGNRQTHIVTVLCTYQEGSCAAGAYMPYRASALSRSYPIMDVSNVHISLG